MQHGKSLSKEKDPGKGLSDTGRQETLKIADVAKMYQVPISAIGHSGRTWAEQTARIFKDFLKVGPSLEKMDGIGLIDDVTDLGNRIDPEANMMIVGHLPYMERPISSMTATRFLGMVMATFWGCIKDILVSYYILISHYKCRLCQEALFYHLLGLQYEQLSWGDGQHFTGGICDANHIFQFYDT